MAETKKTILIVNRKVSYQELKTITDNFSGDATICMTGYGIEIWEKDLITGEMTLIRPDNDKPVIVDGDTGETIEGVFAEEESIDESEDVIPEKTLKKIAKQVNYSSRERGSIFSEESTKIIKENYQTATDLDVSKMILKETGQVFSKTQIRDRRAHLGLTKYKMAEEKSKSKQVKYNEFHFKFLKDNVEKFKNKKLCELFNQRFDINISVQSMTNLMFCHKIKRKTKGFSKKTEKKEEPIEEPIEIETPEMHRKKEIKNRKRNGMSKEAIELIEENYMSSTDDELRELIADQYNVFHDTDKIAEYRESNGMARPEGWSPEGFDLDEENEDP